MKKMLSPEAAEVAAAPLKNKTPNARTLTSDADFIAVATKVSGKWSATPAITLLWTDAATFAQQVTDWKTYYTGSATGRSKVSSEASTLKQLDKKINEALAIVKGYIQEKFSKKLAPPEYYRYGFMKTSDGYEWLADRDHRAANFDLMIAAIAADGFGSKTYGTAFWTALKTDYTTALTASKDNTSSTTINTGNKNNLKAEINKTMKCLRRVLEGNYPDTYLNVIRDWGWQKETY